jgi:AraC family transcriptional regulator of adaptative response / DNA-3-methyladenine glycosylase II
VPATFRLSDLRDLSSAVERARRLVDADCDPVAISDAFAGDPVLGRLVRELPGLRVPGHVDGDELAVRAVLGQQVTVAAARTAAGRLTEQYGVPLGEPQGELTHVFPTAERLAELDPETLPMPRSRGRALVAMCRALADGDLRLDRGADRDDVRRDLLAIPGVGPWTADYIALRALGHPDVFLPTDIGIRDALRRLGRDPADADELAERWRPWRSYAQLHLWQTLSQTSTRKGP